MPFPFDEFAWVYERHWGGFARRVLPELDALALNSIPPPASLLDRGYAVTGVDGAEAVPEFARARAPEATFFAQDALAFSSAPRFDAPFSTYNSLNHLLAGDDLEAAFRNVCASLKPGAPFVFDLNVEQGYEARWPGSFALVEDDHVPAARSRYDRETKLAEVALTTFRQDGGWRRTNLSLTQRCYPEDEVRARLERAGFAGVTAARSGVDVAFEDVGRSSFKGLKAESGQALGAGGA